MENKTMYLILFSTLLTLVICSAILGIAFVKGCSNVSLALQMIALS